MPVLKSNPTETHQRTTLPIAVIDDDASIRRALPRSLAAQGFEVRGFSSAVDFLASSDLEEVFCVVSDLLMPDLNGLELQNALQKKRPGLAIVFLSGHGDVPATAAAMKAGAIDFLEKPIKGSELVEAIARAIERTRRLTQAGNELAILRLRYEKLTPRERQVYVLVASGLLNKQVAAQLGAAEKTVKQHRGRIMRKMQAESLADLVMMAATLGIRRSSEAFAQAKGRLISE